MLTRAFDDKDFGERLIPVLLDILNHKNSKPSVTNHKTNEEEKETGYVEALKACHDLQNATEFSLVSLMLIFYCFNSVRTI